MSSDSFMNWRFDPAATLQTVALKGGSSGGDVDTNATISTSQSWVMDVGAAAPTIGGGDIMTAATRNNVALPQSTSWIAQVSGGGTAVVPPPQPVSGGDAPAPKFVRLAETEIEPAVVPSRAPLPLFPPSGPLQGGALAANKNEAARRRIAGGAARFADRQRAAKRSPPQPVAARPVAARPVPTPVPYRRMPPAAPMRGGGAVSAPALAGGALPQAPALRGAMLATAAVSVLCLVFVVVAHTTEEHNRHAWAVAAYVTGAASVVGVVSVLGMTYVQQKQRA